MKKYIARRLLLMVPTILGVSIIVFGIMRIAPGDVALLIVAGYGADASPGTLEQVERVRKELGLDRPLHVQYVDWLWGFVRFDLGDSYYFQGFDVRDLIIRKAPLSLQLGVMSIIIAVVIGIPGGIVSALRQDRWQDYAFRVFSISFLSLPNFWVGMMMILILLKLTGWIPPAGYIRLHQDPLGNLAQLIWPALVLGTSSSALILRLTRSSMLEVMREDYIRTARAKGLGAAIVLYRHALKNAVLPVVTVIGLQVAFVVTGSVIMETVFALPGLGDFLVMSIRNRDYLVVQAMILMLAVVVVFANLVVDLIYAWLDPRIRYE